MRCMQRIALLIFPLILSVASLAEAQSSVAIVDIGMVFKAHPTFPRELETLRAEADQFQKNAVQLQQQMVAKSEKLQEKLQMWTPDSEEYRNSETQLAQELATLEVQQRSEMRSLMVREAQLHFQTYQQVKKVVNDYCAAKNIRLVLRHTDQKLNVDNPKSVMADVNKNLVFYTPEIDITNEIIRQIGGVASLQGDTSQR